MGIRSWLFADLELPKGVQGKAESGEHAWLAVMCLTGVDYFSTLGYQSGIAFLAAGALSPIATMVLVVVTLAAALPVYRRVAGASPNGQGSIAMLERLFPGWGGKVFVLVLLGFATTDFVVTMTLSAADAAAHFIHNPYTPHVLQSQMGVTLLLLALLGAVFLRGFKEAINIAVVLVGLYLVLNAVLVGAGVLAVWHHMELLHRWRLALFRQHSSVLAMLGVSMLLFPRLALGLSGFETGVAVMPLIRSEGLEQRIVNTRRLLTTAALIMSVFLIATSVITTLLIPAADFAEGGPANGRAMAFLAHQYLGNAFGTAYDISTILVLAFAGASAMAGLLNLIPRYLPGFGMAPEWARAVRPLVLVFLGIATAVTLLFHANVDAQGGAYATGVLFLITSASCAVTVSAQGWLARGLFGAMSVVFIYTTLANVYERPEGLKISCLFILTILLVSLVSRAIRSTELRVTGIELDALAREFLESKAHETVRLIAWNPKTALRKSRADADAEVRRLHAVAEEENIFFLEVERGDASDFKETLYVEGRTEDGHRVLHARSAVVANSIAALMIYLEQTTGCVPHVYFHWTDLNPVVNVLRFIFLGEGDTAPLTHEVLRRAVKDVQRRPAVHVS